MYLSYSVSIYVYVVFVYAYVCTCVPTYRLAGEKKVPSVSSRENYRRIMRQAEDEIFHHGYDVGKTP